MSMNPTFTTSDFIRTVSTVAENYGFQPLHSVAKEVKKSLDTSEDLDHTISAKARNKDSLYGLLANGVSNYCDQKLYTLQYPTSIYSIERVPRTNEIAVSYHIYHVDRSIAEALLIQSLRSLLNDLGYDDHIVRINSLGDSESTTRYQRELTNFLRKRIDHLPPTARELMKEHVILAMQHLVERGHELSYRSPNPLEYLSDISRKHFREIIEFLDISDTPYEIDPKLIGHHECYSDTLFSIDVQNHDRADGLQLEISGGRIDAFTEHHIKTRIPTTGAVVILRDRKIPARISRPRLPTPSVYIVHLGFGPKVRTLLLIDELRRAGIPAYQNVASDSLSEQLRAAEAYGCKYTVIIGQKEYVEGSAILRDMSARNQETIPQDSLVRRLKRSRRLVAS